MAIFFSRRTKHKAPACIRRLLVVEDDALIAFDHEHVLQSAGYDVVGTVNGGEAALAMMNEQHIDAIILDLAIAGQVDGLAVARRAHERGIAVVLVSGHEPGEAARYAFAYLAKPLAKGRLVGALQAMEATLCRGEAPPPSSKSLKFFTRAEGFS